MRHAKRIAAAEVRASLPDVMQDVRRKGERVRITRYGKTVACLVPVEDVEALEACKDELADCHKRAAATRARPAQRKSETA